MWSAVQAILNGLLYGALLSVIGMGMALIFGVMRIVNFAHGAFMMIGMYVTYLLFERLGVSPYLGFFASAATLFGLGIAVYYGLIRWIPPHAEFMQILLTLGAAQSAIGFAHVFFGADFHQVNIPLLGVNYRFFGNHVTINAPWLWSFVISV